MRTARSAAVRPRGDGVHEELTEKNAYHVRIRALKELKRRADEFTWTMVGGVPM